MFRRVRHAVAIVGWPVALVIAVLSFHGRAAAPGAAFDAGDLRRYFVPVRALVLDTVLGGHWPFWQRGIDAGFPMLGSSEMSLFHPTTWLFPFRPIERALTLGLLTHLCVAAVGTFLWLRGRKHSSGAAAVGALVIALGGYTTVHLEHWTFSGTLMWLPFAFLGVDAFIRTARLRWFALTAVAGAGMWYAGAAQIAYFGTLLLGGYALFAALRTPGRLSIVLGVPAGMLLASPVLFAAAELARLSPRAGGTTLQYAGGFYRLEHWHQLAVLLLPHAYGPAERWSGPMFFWEMSGYVGAATLALVFAARPRGMGWYFAAVALVALGACFGTTYPVWGFLHDHLPGYAGFRVPTRALFLVNVCAAYLAAEGVDRLLRQRRWFADVAVVLAGALVAFVAFHLSEHAGAYGFRAEVRQDFSFALWMVGGLVACVLARRWLPVPVLAAAIAALTFVDLDHHFSSYMPVQDAEELARAVPRLPGPVGDAPRVGVIRLPFNLAAGQGLESPVGYSQISIGRVFDMYFAARSGHFRPSATTPIAFEYGEQDIAPYQPYFPIWSTSRVVSAYPLNHPLLTYDGQIPAGFSYTYTAPLPISFWAGNYEILDDAGFQARSAQFRPHEQLFIAPSDAPLPPPSPHNERVASQVVTRSPNESVLRVNAPEDGLVVLLDPWFPGWSVTVDGKDVPLLRADYAFMATRVEQGAHEVRFRYFPSTLKLSLPAVTAVWLALAGWWWLRRRRAAA